MCCRISGSYDNVGDGDGEAERSLMMSVGCAVIAVVKVWEEWSRMSVPPTVRSSSTIPAFM